MIILLHLGNQLYTEMTLKSGRSTTVEQQHWNYV